MKTLTIILIMVLVSMPLLAVADGGFVPHKDPTTTTGKVLHWTGRVLFFTAMAIFSYRAFYLKVDPITGRR